MRYIRTHIELIPNIINDNDNVLVVVVVPRIIHVNEVNLLLSNYTYSVIKSEKFGKLEVSRKGSYRA